MRTHEEPLAPRHFLHRRVEDLKPIGETREHRTYWQWRFIGGEWSTDPIWRPHQAKIALIKAFKAREGIDRPQTGKKVKA